MKPTIILRHRRENLKKCSLRGLEIREDLRFYTYPQDDLPNLDDYLLLKMGAPPLTLADADQGIILIDGTWRLAQIMERKVSYKNARSLPLLNTAYPRRQTECPDPTSGLASIEALFAAYHILGRPTEGLLDFYHWKKSFLQLNEFL